MNINLNSHHVTLALINLAFSLSDITHVNFGAFLPFVNGDLHGAITEYPELSLVTPNIARVVHSDLVEGEKGEGHALASPDLDGPAACQGFGRLVCDAPRNYSSW